MQGLPFEIPQSLSSYITQFEIDPEKGISNLENHLKKRGMDAVGYFLLSWLHHLNGQNNQAIHYALKAKCYAPGSPFFEHLHYFLTHPDHFKAWKPFSPDSDTTDAPEPGDTSPQTLQLDRLIEQLNKAENKKITLQPEPDDKREEAEQPDLGENSIKVGDIASETLARIYEKQNKYDEALRTFEKLVQTRPHRSEYYRKEMERIRNLME
ncbi:tetratricopeptide repeat protein [Natronogracilivirga saccharolytica]|uniref:Tetratricopeptide repeat protein n=1 Tax=Natronogracilivirga saccharolytica TaxID=2812953 RepID=A0A8J7RIE5_9BACT|nr:tetratricopeptide repeat protein [Natronogracilivirga saccharolytica]MBP3191190.1 hypothetical protein [Natronogracilivirga saccharolytica]